MKNCTHRTERDKWEVCRSSFFFFTPHLPRQVNPAMSGRVEKEREDCHQVYLMKTVKRQSVTQHQMPWSYADFTCHLYTKVLMIILLYVICEDIVVILWERSRSGGTELASNNIWTKNWVSWWPQLESVWLFSRQENVWNRSEWFSASVTICLWYTLNSHHRTYFHVMTLVKSSLL